MVQRLTRERKDNTAKLMEDLPAFYEVLEDFLDAIADGGTQRKKLETGLMYKDNFFLSDLCREAGLHYRTIREFLYTNPEWSAKYNAACKAGADRLHMQDYKDLMTAMPETMVEVQHMKLKHEATIRMGKITDRDRFSETVRVENTLNVNINEMFDDLAQRKRLAEQTLKAIDGTFTVVDSVSQNLVKESV